MGVVSLDLDDVMIPHTLVTFTLHTVPKACCLCFYLLVLTFVVSHYFTHLFLLHVPPRLR